MSKATEWADIPMGPALQTYLNIFRDDQPSLPQGGRLQEFANMMLHKLNVDKLNSQDMLVGLVDELVTLGLSTMALHAIQENSKHWDRDEFQRAFLEALAHMTTGDLDQATQCFSIAHQKEPSEPAPYCNLAMILDEQGQHKEAQKWAQAGIEQAPDHIQLWKQLAYSYQKEGRSQEFIDWTQEKNDWVGLCVAAEYTPDPTINRRIWLERVYKGGERSMAFLTEYTGCLGACGSVEDIPAVLWDARHQKESTPWELELNGLQAYLSMEKDEEFLKESPLFLERTELPDEVRTMVLSWQKECHTEGAPK